MDNDITQNKMGTDPNTTNLTNCKNVLASVLGLAMHFLNILTFDRKNPQKLYPVCSYIRLLELACACKALVEKDALIGIPVLLRSMFEIDIDLTNLIREPEYFKYMYAAFLKEKHKFVNEVEKPKDNPFFVDIKIQQNSKADIEKTEGELAKLKNAGFSPLNIKQRAERAGKLNEYVSLYKDLCLDTHNNISSLEDWHIEMNGSDYKVAAFKKKAGDLLPHLIAILGILLHQTKNLAGFLQIDGIQFEKYFQELESIQQSH